MPRLMTLLQAMVPRESWPELTRAYEGLLAETLPQGLEETALLQDAADPDSWAIASVWSSLEDVEAMRKAGTPGGVLAFRAAGVEPQLRRFTVVVGRRR